ncbi:MAG TPA: RNB domain-containing ribonuclease, partial [Solirubrobacteraceae bacterium]|nr:RNB domain-containing ribonuclease [Solirubrobacteraceae bacterium]
MLARRGRFWTAEPLFPKRSSEPAPRPGRGGGRLTLGTSLGPRAPRGLGAGEMVLVEPPRRGGQARVLRAIGRPEIARDAIEALLLDRGMPRGFKEAVEREAREVGGRGPGALADPDAPPEERGHARRDLRELPTFTIDPRSARDFDDAISAETLPDGGVRVWVHIADVSAYVRPGSLLDREAGRRSTSVYAPGAVEPMLPRGLSNGACSLVPGEDRLTVTVEMEIYEGEVRRRAFYRSVIRSDER